MLSNLTTKFREKLNTDTHFAELIKGSGIAFVLRIVGIITGYVFTLLVTRTLGDESWGIFTLSLVVLQIASVIGRLVMDTALLRFIAECTVKKKIDILKGIFKRALTLVVSYSNQNMFIFQFQHRIYLIEFEKYKQQVLIKCINS